MRAILRSVGRGAADRPATTQMPLAVGRLRPVTAGPAPAPAGADVATERPAPPPHAAVRGRAVPRGRRRRRPPDRGGRPAVARGRRRSRPCRTARGRRPDHQHPGRREPGDDRGPGRERGGGPRHPSDAAVEPSEAPAQAVAADPGRRGRERRGRVRPGTTAGPTTTTTSPDPSDPPPTRPSRRPHHDHHGARRPRGHHADDQVVARAPAAAPTRVQPGARSGRARSSPPVPERATAASLVPR